MREVLSHSYHPSLPAPSALCEILLIFSPAAGALSSYCSIQCAGSKGSNEVFIIKPGVSKSSCTLSCVL
eukprot:1857083-Amphidinium_carterae.1